MYIARIPPQMVASLGWTWNIIVFVLFLLFTDVFTSSTPCHPSYLLIYSFHIVFAVPLFTWFKQLCCKFDSSPFFCFHSGSYALSNKGSLQAQYWEKHCLKMFIDLDLSQSKRMPESQYVCRKQSSHRGDTPFNSLNLINGDKTLWPV